MYYNQQNNNLNQQFLNQQDNPIPVNQNNYNSGDNAPPINSNINIPSFYPQQVNLQMNIPQQINSQQMNLQMNIPQQINPNSLPQGYPPNYFQNYPPNFIKPEELFEIQKRMLAGEKVNLTNQINQQQSNKFVLPPQNLHSGNKLTISFEKIRNILLEIFIIIIGLMIIGSSMKIILIICNGVLFLIEQICVLYYGKKKIEIVKDKERNKLTVKIINYLCIARKTFEYDLSNVFLDVQIVKRLDNNNSNITYYRLIIINTFKDGVAIDLDSSSVQKNPVKVLDYFEHINAHKFNGQLNMIKTLKTFADIPSEEESPLSFSIKKYMKQEENIFVHYNNFVNNSRSKYVRFNDHFFSYFPNEPIKKKSCHGGSITLLLLINFILLQINFITIFNDKKNLEIIYIIFYSVLLFLLLSICLCYKIKSSGKLLRIDMIYSNNFDRLFIGLVKNDKISYINSFIFKLDEVEKFVIQKNDINERGFHIKSINKVNGLIQDICHLYEPESEFEGILYILNQRIQNNVNNINNNYNNNNNNGYNNNNNIDNYSNNKNNENIENINSFTPEQQ